MPTEGLSEERLKRSLEMNVDACNQAIRERDEARARVDELLAENERYRSALEEISDDHGLTWAGPWKRDRARKALHPTEETGPTVKTVRYETVARYDNPWPAEETEGEER